MQLPYRLGHEAQNRVLLSSRAQTPARRVRADLARRNGVGVLEQFGRVVGLVCAVPEVVTPGVARSRGLELGADLRVSDFEPLETRLPFSLEQIVEVRTASTRWQ